MTGQTYEKREAFQDRHIQDLEGGQHNYVNTPTSHDPEQTPANVNGEEGITVSTDQILCPINLPLTSASLYLIPYRHSHYCYIKPMMPIFCDGPPSIP